MKSGMLRSWPWSLALAAVLAGFVLLGLFGVALRSSVVELLISAAVTGLAAAALVRTLNTGVRLTASGLIIRELTRSTPYLWSQIRTVTCAKSIGRGYVPVLTLVQNAQRVEVSVLAAYRQPVAQRRADVLAAALTSNRPPRSRRR